MHRLLPIATASLALLALPGCGGSSPEAGEPARGASARVETAVAPAPCDWLAPAAVEAVLGPFAAPPRRVGSASSLEPDAYGDACLYTLAAPRDPVLVALQVDLTGSLAEEGGLSMGRRHARQVAREQGFDAAERQRFGTMVDGLTSAPGAEPAGGPGEPAATPWDFTGGVPGLAIWRVGHVAVRIGGETLRVPGERLAELATRVRAALATDRPYALPGHVADPADFGEDPCGLITRAEVEALLGPLVAQPYRSSPDAPLADGSGQGCAYLAHGHRALVVAAERSDGRMLFGVTAGFAGMIRSTVGGADEGALLDGPWERATATADGTLYFLAGDQLLKISHRAAGIDVADAARLAALAMPRLQQP